MMQNKSFKYTHRNMECEATTKALSQLTYPRVHLFHCNSVAGSFLLTYAFKAPSSCLLEAPGRGIDGIDLPNTEAEPWTAAEERTNLFLII